MDWTYEALWGKSKLYMQRALSMDREGAEFLVEQQNRFTGSWVGELYAESNALVATSFALLFLSKDTDRS